MYSAQGCVFSGDGSAGRAGAGSASTRPDIIADEQTATFGVSRSTAPGGSFQPRPSATAFKNAAYCGATRSHAHRSLTYFLARSPSARANSGRLTSKFKYSKMKSISRPSTGTFKQTSSGSSAKEPMSDTRTGRPSPSARSSGPELSPAVGYRKLRHMSTALMYP